MSDHPAPPNPGSTAAIDAGCTCPVMDNAYGRGHDGKFWYSGDCPLHAFKREPRDDEGGGQE